MINTNINNFTNKNVEYLKYNDEEKNVDCILKYKKVITQYSENVYELKYHLTIVLIKEKEQYKKVAPRTILALKTSFDKAIGEIDLIGDIGKNFILENYRNINFRGKELFVYFCSIILNDTIKLLDTPENYNIRFPDASLKFVNEFEQDKNNYLRRNKAYEKLGFRINFYDDKKIEGRLLNISVNDLTLQLQIPSSILYYENAYDLICDTLNLIPFSKQVLKPFKNYSIYDFVTQEKEIKNASFDVSKIIGTDHPSYYDLSWIEVLENSRTPYIKYLLLKEEKDRNNIEFFKRKRDYKYTDDPWGIHVFNGSAYISEGNHRTVISRFLYELDLIDKEMTGLKYVKYFQVDKKQQKKFSAIKKWLKKYYAMYDFRIESRKKTINEISNANKKTTFYKVEYRRELGQYIEIIDGEEKLVTHVMDFENIESLQEYLRTVTGTHKKELFFKVHTLIKFIKRKIPNKFFVVLQRFN